MPETQQTVDFLSLEVGGKSVEEILASALVLNAMHDAVDNVPPFLQAKESEGEEKHA